MRGMALVPETRELFGSMAVEDNLVLRRLSPAATRRAELARPHRAHVYAVPAPARARSQLAGTLSGGERQMLAVGRALMAEPKLLMLDEPSLGLAPLVVREVFRIIERLRRRGTSILLIEQNARAALEVSDHGYVLETGTLALEGPASRTGTGYPRDRHLPRSTGVLSRRAAPKANSAVRSTKDAQ